RQQTHLRGLRRHGRGRCVQGNRSRSLSILRARSLGPRCEDGTLGASVEPHFCSRAATGDYPRRSLRLPGSVKMPRPASPGHIDADLWMDREWFFSVYEENKKLPAQKGGARYKNTCHKQGWFCRGLSVPCSSGRRGHFCLQTESPSVGCGH